jgi:hypothetical protein
VAAAGGGLGLIVVVAIAAALLRDKGAGDSGGGATGGDDDVVVDVPTPPPTPDIDFPRPVVEAQKVIWAYHDGELAAYQQLCVETIELHKGILDFKLLNEKDVFQYINRSDLPTDWETLKPKYKRDTAITALMAHHGGIALDINTIMFRSFDEWWDEDVEETGVAFRGFYYKSRAELATWFYLVGRGDGMFRTAVRRQKNMSGNEPAGCLEKDREAELCYGSSVVAYGLCIYDSDYCKCYKGQTKGCDLLRIESYDTPGLYELTDPRKSVQPPLEPNKLPKEEKWQPNASIDDPSAAREFAKFKIKFNGEELPFISLQAPTSRTEEIAGKSRHELLKGPEAQSTFFYQWLCLAKHPETSEDACGK